MSSALEACVFMGKNYSENVHSIKNTEDKFHFKTDVRHIWKLDNRTIRWDFGVSRVSIQLGRFSMEKTLVNDEELISLSHAKVYVFSDSVLCPGKVNENPASNTVWEEQLSWFIDSPQYRTLDTIDGEPMEFEWNIFPGFTTLQLVHKVQEFTSKMGDPSEFKGRIIFMSMFNDIIWGTTDNEQECIANATFVSLFAKRFPAGRWSFLGLGSEKKWYSAYNERPRGEWDRVAELMMIKFGESGHPVFRATSPVSRGTLKSKGTRVGRTTWHIGRASKLIDNDTNTFDWKPRTRKFIAKTQETSGKAFTTKSSEKDLYWCKIPENSWSRTVLHDEAHWRVLTIYTTFDMSWVHFATRWWKINWPKRLDSKEHQNWARVGSHNQPLARLIWSGN